MSSDEVSPEPTFLEKLRKAGESPMTPMAWEDYYQLLIDKAETIERLIEAAVEVGKRYPVVLDHDPDGCPDCLMASALAALNEGIGDG